MVYLGAPDIQAYVAPECDIDMRRFATYACLQVYLKSLSAKEVHAYREAARAYLESPAFRPFTKQTFAERFVEIVEQDADGA